MKTSNTRKRITLVLAVVCCLSLLIGSLALFTAEDDIDATAKVGTLTITADGEITADLKLGGDEDIANSATLDNWNPGDEAPFDYTVTATGTKALIAQETLTLTVTPASGNTLVPADAKITIVASDGSALTGTPVAEGDGYKVVYEIDEFTLDGTEEDIDGTGNVSTAAKAYKLVFAAAAGNEYQGATIAIHVDVNAEQYANNH